MSGRALGGPRFCSLRPGVPSPSGDWPGPDRRARKAWLHRYKDETELSTLRGLMAAGNRWGHRSIAPTALGRCLERWPARNEWLPWVRLTSAALPTLGRLHEWPAYMRNACLSPSWGIDSVEVEAVDDFVLA